MKAKATSDTAGKLPSQAAHLLAGAVAGARPRVERRLAAALALDIVDYSLMIGDDDEGTHQRVGKALARVSRQVRKYEGNVVSFSGDGLMAVFPSSRAALQCGIGIQKWMRDRSIKVEPKQRIIFRLGIHAGELVFQGWCASGDPLNIAARLERICQPGEICISATLLDQAEQVPGISLESMGARKLKNIRQPVQVYRVTLADPAEAGALDVRTSTRLSAKEVWGRQPSIAVLPLGYVGGDAGDAYFADDIVEGVVALLTDLKELVVIWRSKAGYAGRYLDAREFGRAFGVRYVLRGFVRHSITTVRVTTELCDAENGATIRADTTEVLLGERFDWQHRIAQRIVVAVMPHIRDEELRRASRWRQNEPGACELTLPASPHPAEHSRHLDVVGRWLPDHAL